MENNENQVAEVQTVAPTAPQIIDATTPPAATSKDVAKANKAEEKAKKEHEKAEKKRLADEKAAAVTPKIVQNGVTQPGDNTTSKKIWDIADSLSAAKQAPAARKEVVTEAMKAEINVATASTQYGKWRVFHGLKGSDEVAATPTAA